jgi:diamine N-acetyltransferase
MALRLNPVDASNWRAMINLEVRSDQESFVAAPIKSLAMCYVRAWGDEYDYRPFIINDEQFETIGYVTIVADPKSADDYWIDDIMIDAGHQGKGYGRSALDLTLRHIVKAYPNCAKIRLTCFRGNDNAAALYESVGFVRTGRLHPEFGEPEYALSGTALKKYRR